MIKNSQNRAAMVATAVFALVVGSSPAWALNITVNDKLGIGGSGQGGEYRETEPGTINSQIWDNEAFVVKGNKLVLVSGFNFKTGVYDSGSRQTFTSGDVFIDTDNDALWPAPTLGGGNGYQTINNINYGYNYVLDLNFANNTFNVVKLNDGAANLTSGYFRQNDGGNPFQYVDGGELKYTKGMVFREGLSRATIAADYGLDPASVYAYNNFAVELDMSWWNTEFPDATAMMTHFNLGCGNDLMTGQLQGSFDQVPDGGSTLMLLGLGIGGLVWVRSRMARRS
jgi:hypothetical protein